MFQEESIRSVKWSCKHSGPDYFPIINIARDGRALIACVLLPSGISFFLKVDVIMQYLLEASEPCTKRSNITVETDSITKELSLPTSVV